MSQQMLNQPRRVGRQAAAAFLAILMVAPAPQWVFAAPRKAVTNPLTRLQIVESADTTVITVTGQRAPTFSTYRMEEPPRLFVDIPGGEVASLQRSIAVSNGVIERVETQPFRRGKARYGRVIVTFTRAALFHVRVDNNAVVIVVDGSDRTLSKAQTVAIAKAKKAAQHAAEREQKLLETLRKVRARELDAATKRRAALKEQQNLRGQLDALRRDDASQQQVLATMAKRVSDSQSQLRDREAAFAKIQAEAKALRTQLRQGRTSLANAVAQRRSEEARVALLRQQIAKERKALGQNNQRRIAALQNQLKQARSQAGALRSEVKRAREVRRKAQAEEVTRLKAQIAGQANELSLRLKTAGKKQSASQKEIQRLKKVLETERLALKTQQTSLIEARKADSQRAVAERRWKAAEVRAERAARQLAERTRQLAQARRAMVKIAQQEEASRRRTKQISELLSKRETELKNARTRLQEREKTLKRALSQAVDRERAALESGKKEEAATAAKQRKELESVRKTLSKRLSEQSRSLAALQAQAKQNAKARQQAESQTRRLSEALKQREARIVDLAAQAQRNRLSASKAKKLEQQAAKLRKQLRQQAAKRDAQLDQIEGQLTRRITAIRTELSAAKKTKATLKRSLDNLKRSAKASERKNAVMSKLLTEREQQLNTARANAADAEKLAKDAMIRAKRVAQLLVDRERQLGQMADALKRRDSVLAVEVKRAKAREMLAKRAGRKVEMAAAAKLRDRLTRERGVLKRQLGAQEAALQAARKEAQANATARANAELEAHSLRAQLAKRTKAMASLRKQRGQQANQSLQKQQRAIAVLRLQLTNQLRSRDAKLSAMENRLGTKLSAARGALKTAKLANQTLEAELAQARARAAAAQKKMAQQARARAAALKVAQARAAAAQKKMAREEKERLAVLKLAHERALAEARANAQEAEKLAKDAMIRTKRVAKLLVDRERQVGQMAAALRRRDDVLAAELKRAKTRELVAKRAGRKIEMAAAANLRTRLSRKRSRIKARLGAQKAALVVARKEARANASARAKAEREALSLRAQLAKRTKAMTSLRKRRGQEARRSLLKQQKAITALRVRQTKKLRLRDAKLSALEKRLGTRLSAARGALKSAKLANETLESELAAARTRAAVERKRAEQADARAARVGRLLAKRDGEFKRLETELAKRQKAVSAALAKAKKAEVAAKRSGRQADARRLTAERTRLEASFERVRTDLLRSQSAVQKAQDESKAHATARQASERRAERLAQTLADRESELAQIRKASKSKSAVQVAAATSRVQKARHALKKEREDRAQRERQLTSEMQRQLASVKSEMARREKERLAALRRVHERALAAARASARFAAKASEKRTARITQLLTRRERELQALKTQTAAQLAQLQRALVVATARAKNAKKSGRRVEASRAKKQVQRIAAEVKKAKRVSASRATQLRRASREATAQRQARQRAERKAAKLSRRLTERAEMLAKLRRSSRSSSVRVAAAERQLEQTQRDLERANAKLDAEVKATRDRLQAEITKVKAKVAATFAAKERSLRLAHASRERALRSALAAEQDRRRLAEAAANSAGKPRLNGYLERQQNRIAILESRASREREARERVEREKRNEQAQLIAMKAKLKQIQRRGKEQRSEAEIQRRAAALAAKMVAAAKKRDAAEEADRRAAQERRRIRQQAAVERMRARRGAQSEASVRVKDVKITAEGYHRGQVALPISGQPRYEVMKTNERRVILRLLATKLPNHLQRVFDTRQLRGPMERVTVFRPQSHQNETRVVVDLLQPASNVITIKDGRLIWEFIRAGQKAPGPQQFAAGGSFGARAPQPMAPRGGVAGNPVGAGVNANPIKTPWRQSRRYSGKRINLTIKDADIRHVLTFLAREGNINIIAGPEVTGDVTFHLENIPWDLALDVILRARGLDYVRQSGVIRVSTLAKLKKEFDMAVERRKKLQEVKQLVVRIIPVNYGAAKKLQVQAKTILSKSGSVSVNNRTNSLLIKDTEEHVAAVEEMVRKLDAQTPQVLVEARIVEASSNFSKDVGIQWGGNYAMSSVYGNETGLAFPSVVGVAGGADGGQAITDGLASALPNYAVNMPAAVGAGSGGAIGLTLGSLGGAGNLSLRLSAAEQEGTVKIVSSPKVLTLDNKTAMIRQGISIPISVVSAQGVQTTFFNADLQLQVTPHITQDGNVLMSINITKSEPDFSNRAADGNPTITQRQAQTELLLGDGDTTVIGGIYTRSTSESIKKVPFFGSLPLIGGLFRSRSEQDKRTELLIFITPRIVNRAQAMRVGK